MPRLLCLLALLSVVLPLNAAERGFVPARRAASEHVALIIGNGAYPDRPLTNPVNDAVDVGTAFESIGFQVTVVTDADKAQMLQAIQTFGDRLTKAKAAVFYYAGHGMQVGGSNWLLPVARQVGEIINREGEVRVRAVDANEVLVAMERAKVPVAMVILDACRNNPFTGAVRSGTKGLALLDAPPGSLVVYATAPGQVAEDGNGRNSPFSQAFMTQLLVPGQDIETMLRNVKKSVQKTTQGAQVPWSSSSMTDTFTFVPVIGAEEVRALHLEAERKLSDAAEQQKRAEVELLEITSRMRSADTAEQARLLAKQRRIEQETAATSAAGAEALRQADLAAAAANAAAELEISNASDETNAFLRQRNAEEETRLKQSRASLDAYDARIREAKAKLAENSPELANLDAMVGVIAAREKQERELARIQQEADAMRQQMALEAAERKRTSLLAAAARQRQAESEAKQRRQQAVNTADLSRLRTQYDMHTKHEELQAIAHASRLNREQRMNEDIAKFERIRSSGSGSDLIATAWSTICLGWHVDASALEVGDLIGFRYLCQINDLAPPISRPTWASDFIHDAYGSRAACAPLGACVLRWLGPGFVEMPGTMRRTRATHVTTGFWITTVPISADQYRTIMSPMAGSQAPDDTYQKAADCADLLTRTWGVTYGLTVRLPTEAEYTRAATLAGILTFVPRRTLAGTTLVMGTGADGWEWCSEWFTPMDDLARGRIFDNEAAALGMQLLRTPRQRMGLLRSLPQGRAGFRLVISAETTP